MKGIFLICTITLALFQGSSSFLYKKENRYSHILRKYSGIHSPEVSGLNLKITDESLNGLVDKLVDEVVVGEEDVDKAMFQFEGKY